MKDEQTSEKEEPKLGKTLVDDFKRKDFFRTLKRELKELKEFFLTEARKKQLQRMGRFRQALYIFIWLFKKLFLSLSPTRRILFFISLVLIFSYDQNNASDQNRLFASFLILMFILLLELKDKFLARNELQAGRTVQRALMPEPSPDVPGWSLWLFTKPANEVGGDLVDFLPLGKERFGLTLGDIAGKGLGAALLMVKLQATLRALAPDCNSLSELGSKLNEIFYRDSIPNRFASLIYLELPVRKNEIRILNAGHLPPLILKKLQIEELAKGDAAIGLALKVKYHEHEIQIQKGDSLLIYSDGVIEAQNEQGEFFGEQRLMDSLPAWVDLSPAEIGKRLLDSIDHFVGPAPSTDDLSLIIVKKIS
ncbi:MAG: PP2C family protein-serine/threonine phosphatase [bacterium]